MSKLKLTYFDFHGGCGEPTRTSVVRMGFEGKEVCHVETLRHG
jgi:hypothetical protein